MNRAVFAAAWGIAALWIAAPLAVFGASTTTWEMNGYQDFLRGRLNGLSLTRDGRLVLGPKVDTVFASDQPEIWSVAQASDGSLYVGTGHRGRLYKVDPSGKSTLVWTADQPEIFAVAIDPKGAVYAATSPDGAIYRIEDGKAAEYFAPHARYIWALQFAPDGTLFAGTGDSGRIFRVTSAGHGDVYYDTGQSHVTSLALDREGRLLAGSEPNGILYRITAPNKAFVLYNASLPEIRAIVPGADGAIYAAALGGSIAKRTGAANANANSNGPVVVAPATSITVTDTQGGLNPAPNPDAPKPAAPAQSTPTITTGVSTTDNANVEHSAIYRINPDNTVETLWSSKEENAYDLAIASGQLVFVTDEEGRIYRLDKERKATLLAQANEGEATRLLASSNGLVAATGGIGKILRLSTSPGPAGSYESPVHDAGSVARWGRLSWLGDGRGVRFRTRTGNSARPDGTWSDWSTPMASAANSALASFNVTSPNARYIQWRADFTAAPGAAASLDDVTIAYLPQNTPPNVRSISVSTQASAPKAATAGANVYSVTVTDTGEAPPAAGTSAQTLSRIAGQQIVVTWQADDPEGDRLVYSLYFRGEDERDWKLIRANLTDNTFVLDPDMFADGRYFFRVVASDRPSNPADLARETELISAPVLIDNTPPSVTAGAPQRNGAAIEIGVDAEDRASALRRCEYSVDAGPWLPVEAADGVTDGPREHFVVRLDNLPAGEHLVAIRVYDAAGNAGLTKVLLR